MHTSSWTRGLLALGLGLVTGTSQAGFTQSSGDVLKYAMPAAAAGLAGYEQDWQGLKQFGLAFGSTAATTWALKQGVQRERPNGSGDDAFPSGHAASAFSSASFIQRRYGWQLGAPAYLLAAWTGYSRIPNRDHHWSDVLAGAAIGVGFSYLWVEADPAWQLTPWTDGKQYGLRLDGSF
ncbi:phosphatase PAP2 family protein [Pseudaeromonas paramecii]|uniref:phosphatase PAP2 family protein n=1 Tax=Pseudaeromonas paramecii TaxID=2138166 RepID=UPI0031EF9E7D